MAIFTKKISVGAFAKKGIDFKDGDTLVIANEGKEVIGQFGAQDVFLVKLPSNDEKNINVNQTSMNGLIDAYGEESKNWIGKNVKVHLINQNVSGKFVKVAYLSHPDAILTEEGFVLPSKKPAGYPTEEISPDDIPFN